MARGDRGFDQAGLGTAQRSRGTLQRPPGPVSGVRHKLWLWPPSGTVPATGLGTAPRAGTQPVTPLPAGPRLCNFSANATRRLGQFQESFLWPVLVAEFLVAVAGNGLALHRFRTREPRPWNPAVVFSAQLAVSNLLYALALLPLAAYLHPPKHWRYGAAACRLERFLFACNLLGGVAFLTCISLHRYLGIVHPFFARGHLRPKHAWAASGAGWALAALLAAPTLGFSGLKLPACTECQGAADPGLLGAYWAYALALAALGGALPLLLSLAAYGALGRAVLRSPSLGAAEKLRVAALVASGVALYAVSYVPYHVTHVLNVDARRRWLERCPHFSSEEQAVRALELGPFLAYQVMRGVMPLATCIHPLLYMAVAPSLSCCTERRGPGDGRRSHQDLPLSSSANSTSKASA
uniref:Purinergic receptor P2Y11 n=1 Tax=Cavia porcellus TaxID=10141 RepID=H0W1R9_CAVPO